MGSFKNNNSTSEGMAFVCTCHLGPHVAAETGDSQLTIPREVRKKGEWRFWRQVFSALWVSAQAAPSA